MPKLIKNMSVHVRLICVKWKHQEAKEPKHMDGKFSPEEARKIAMQLTDAQAEEIAAAIQLLLDASNVA